MHFEVINLDKTKINKPLQTKWLKKVVGEFNKNKMFKKHKRSVMAFSKSKSLNIAFVNSTKIKKINHQFRGHNKATDILSFHGDNQGLLGELILCPKIVKQKSRKAKISFQGMLVYLYIHGILHLLGFDHEKSKRDATVMFEIQDEIFRTYKF